MAGPLVAVSMRGPHAFDFDVAAPIGGRRHRASVRAKANHCPDTHMFETLNMCSMRADEHVLDAGGSQSQAVVWALTPISAMPIVGLSRCKFQG